MGWFGTGRHMPQLSAARLFDDNREKLRLEWIAGRSGGTRRFREPDSMDVRTADLVGHLNLIHSTRIHVLGAPEVAYVERMEPARRLHYATELIVGGPLGVIVAGGRVVPGGLARI